MLEIPRFRDPRLCLWQSAVAEVLRKELGDSHDSTIDHEVMKAASDAAIPFADANPQIPASEVASAPMMASQVAAAGVSPEFAVGDKLRRCADLYLRLALAGSAFERAKVLAEFAFGTCDWNWTKVLAVYEKYVRLHHAKVPYIEPTGPDDLRSVFSTLPERATIGFLADWGTGTSGSIDLLRKLLTHRKPGVPFFFIHLGDIYYSGTDSEVNRFAEICRGELSADEPVFTLAGNHDMYAGGAPYYRLIGGLNPSPYTQKTSYFVLRNDYWQFQAMDTGLNDRNPLTVDSAMTKLNEKEAEWHRARLAEAGTRKVILLSHHQPFSPFAKIGDGYVNEELLKTFEGFAIAAWLWGHEHNLAIFEPYRGIAKGRCIGSGAIPVRLSESPYDVQFDEVKYDKRAILDNDGSIFGHAYAVMEIDGAKGKLTYHQDPDPTARNPLAVDVW